MIIVIQRREIELRGSASLGFYKDITSTEVPIVNVVKNICIYSSQGDTDALITCTSNMSYLDKIALHHAHHNAWIASCVSYYIRRFFVISFQWLDWFLINSFSQFVCIKIYWMIGKIQSVHSMLNSSEKCSCLKYFPVIVHIEIWIMDYPNPAFILYCNSNYDSNELQVTFYEAFGSVKRINPYSGILRVKRFELRFDL